MVDGNVPAGAQARQPRSGVHLGVEPVVIQRAAVMQLVPGAALACLPNSSFLPIHSHQCWWLLAQRSQAAQELENRAPCFT